MRRWSATSSWPGTQEYSRYAAKRVSSRTLVPSNGVRSGCPRPACVPGRSARGRSRPGRPSPDAALGRRRDRRLRRMRRSRRRAARRTRRQGAHSRSRIASLASCGPRAISRGADQGPRMCVSEPAVRAALDERSTGQLLRAWRARQVRSHLPATGWRHDLALARDVVALHPR